MPLKSPLSEWTLSARLTLTTTCFAIACAALAPVQMAAASEAEQSTETLELAELEPAEIQLSEQEAAAWRAQAEGTKGSVEQTSASEAEQKRRGDGATTGPLKR